MCSYSGVSASPRNARCEDESIRPIHFLEQRRIWNGRQRNLCVRESSASRDAGRPKWLGVIQHDMMMYDHGMPPGPKQSPTADINIEYQKDSKMADGSARLAEAFKAANALYAKYPATIGTNMAGTDSIRFEDLVPAISVREAERITGIIRG